MAIFVVVVLAKILSFFLEARELLFVLPEEEIIPLGDHGHTQRLV